MQRFDVGRLDKFERTPSGGLRIPGAISRIGVQVYKTEDGTEIRELRLPEEVFSADSVASFENAPITDLHPTELVTPASWKQFALGVVRAPHVDGQVVAAEFLVFDAGLIAAVESGDRIEVSGGYTCELEETSGTWNGQPYDVIQRQIRANHVALGPRGWGRAGPEVALRLDSARHQVPPGSAPAQEKKPMAKITFDGLEYEAGSTSHLAAVESVIKRKDSEISAAQGRADAATSSAEQLRAENAQLKQRADAASSEAEIDKRVESRLALVDRARGVLGAEFDFAGKKDGEVRRAVLDKLGVKVDEKRAKDDAYIEAAFDAAVQLAKDASMETPDPEQDEPDGDEPQKTDRRDGRVRVERGDKRSALKGLDKVRADNAAALAELPKKWAVGTPGRG